MYPTGGDYSFTAALADEAATYRLMTDIAAIIEPGDVITLSGDLGAGKTTFARALIRYLAADDTIEVPSPTFTFTQSYTLPRFAVVHVDLYRLSGPSELPELGFDDVPEGSVTLVEWPDRAVGFLPASRLDIALTLEPQNGQMPAMFASPGTAASPCEPSVSSPYVASSTAPISAAPNVSVFRETHRPAATSGSRGTAQLTS